MELSINTDWKSILEEEFDKDYFKSLVEFVQKEYQTKTCFPAKSEIFNAFNSCSFEDVKVVILGQDPYHGKGQAHGLSFSVPNGIKIPPSLRNIYKELYSDLEISPSISGDLTNWNNQGVLLLNSTLTVRESEPGSHQNKGWEEFTNTVIQHISDAKQHVVFVLWGKYAQKKGEIIDSNNHLVINSAHPSPFSAHRGFFGSKPFSKTNEFLTKKGIEPINWETKVNPTLFS